MTAGEDEALASLADGGALEPGGMPTGIGGRAPLLATQAVATSASCRSICITCSPSLGTHASSSGSGSTGLRGCCWDMAGFTWMLGPRPPPPAGA